LTVGGKMVSISGGYAHVSQGLRDVLIFKMLILLQSRLSKLKSRKVFVECCSVLIVFPSDLDYVFQKAVKSGVYPLLGDFKCH